MLSPDDPLEKLIKAVTAAIRNSFGDARFPDCSPSDFAISAFRSYWEKLEVKEIPEHCDFDQLTRELICYARHKALHRTRVRPSSPLNIEILASEDSIRDDDAYREMLTIVEKGMNELLAGTDEATQQILRSLLDGESQNETAKQFNISVSTVQRRWATFRKKMQLLLHREVGADGMP